MGCGSTAVIHTNCLECTAGGCYSRRHDVFAKESSADELGGDGLRAASHRGGTGVGNAGQQSNAKL